MKKCSIMALSTDLSDTQFSTRAENNDPKGQEKTTLK
jgi:hypothetical protein